VIQTYSALWKKLTKALIGIIISENNDKIGKERKSYEASCGMHKHQFCISSFHFIGNE